MRNQLVNRPRIWSTSTSRGSSSGQTSACRAFQLSSPSAASALDLARAISISGLVDLRRPVGLGAAWPAPPAPEPAPEPVTEPAAPPDRADGGRRLDGWTR